MSHIEWGSVTTVVVNQIINQSDTSYAHPPNVGTFISHQRVEMGKALGTTRWDFH
jgi:hypothetical protein